MPRHISLKSLRAQLQPFHITVTLDDGEYKVQTRAAAAHEAGCYYTTDAQDALNTGLAMAKENAALEGTK